MTDIRPEWRELEGEVEETVGETFSQLRAPVRKNLAALVIGLVMVLRMPRGWYGRLSLSGVARGLPTRGRIEVLRRRARHGSRRTLSVLSLALMLVADPFLLTLSNLTRVLREPLQAFRSGLPIGMTIAV